MIASCKRIAASRLFHDLIVVVILLNALILGLETSPHIMQSAGSGMDASPLAAIALATAARRTPIPEIAGRARQE